MGRCSAPPCRHYAGVALGANAIAEVPSGQRTRRREIDPRSPAKSSCSRPPSRPPCRHGRERLAALEPVLRAARPGHRRASSSRCPPGTCTSAPAFIATAAAMALLGAGARGGDRGRRRARRGRSATARPRRCCSTTSSRCDLPGRRRAALPGARRPGEGRPRPSSGTAAIVFGVYLAVELPQLPADRRLPLPARRHEPARRDPARSTCRCCRGRSRPARSRPARCSPTRRSGCSAVAMLAVMLVSYYSLLRSVVDGAVAARRAARAGRGARGAAPRRDPRDGRDARHARPDDRAPLGGGRALRQGDRGRGRAAAARPGAGAHGRAAARRRQVHVPRPHADRHDADRGGLGADPVAPAARRGHRQARARLRGGRGDRALPPRADRRARLPAPAERGGHPGARPDPLRRGLLRRDDGA